MLTVPGGAWATCGYFELNHFPQSFTVRNSGVELCALKEKMYSIVCN